eukprot:SM000003S11044  [mRNA]  locus=s3:577533:580129:- [translate_table: standard]
MASGRKFVAAVTASEASAFAFTWSITNLFRADDHVLVLTSQEHAAGDFPSVEAASAGEYAVPLTTAPVETEAVDRKADDASRSVVNKYLQLCEQAKIAATGEVTKGDSGSWIVAEASRIGADAVIVGTGDHGLLKRTLVGTTSDYVLHNCEQPVIIVRHSAEKTAQDVVDMAGKPRKIVVAVDNSKEALYAFTWCLQNIATEEDAIVVLHVQEPGTSATTTIGTGEFGMEEVYMPVDGSNKEDVAALEASEKLVELFMRRAQETESKFKVEGKVVPGPSDERVLQELVSMNADLVVVGTHNKGMVARTFLGSVSDYLAHNSPCPLVVAKMPKSDTGVTEPDPMQTKDV